MFKKCQLFSVRCYLVLGTTCEQDIQGPSPHWSYICIQRVQRNKEIKIVHFRGRVNKSNSEMISREWLRLRLAMFSGFSEE